MTTLAASIAVLSIGAVVPLAARVLRRRAPFSAPEPAPNEVERNTYRYLYRRSRADSAGTDLPAHNGREARTS